MSSEYDMRKVHIALVGRQTAPVYNGIVAVLPDLVEFIYSEDSIPQKDELTLRAPCEVVESDPLDPTDLNEILERAKSLAEKYSSDEITVNISSGTKSWSHIFGMIFQPMENATVMYIDQTGMLWDYHKMEGRQIKPLDMKTLLSLYGSSSRDIFIPLDEYTREDSEVRKKIAKVRGINFRAFNKLCALSDIDPFNDPRKKYSLPDGSFVEWKKGRNGENDIVDLHYAVGNQSFHFESPHAASLVFKSGWFEHKIAEILKSWKYAKNIYLNCHFKAEDFSDKNEVDIIVETDARLLFVECKTSLSDSTAIDKFASVYKVYGGIGSLGIFITDSPMNKKSKDKCLSHGLLPAFALKEKREEVNPSKALYDLLNASISQINM